jgi:hypothetical protein
MHYKDNIITSVRKVRYDELWHVYYLVNSQHSKLRETYDRVSKAEAMSVIRKMKNPNSRLSFA